MKISDKSKINLMLQFKQLDSEVSIQQQIENTIDNEPVVLFNLFSVSEEEIPAVLEAWTKDANFLKTQPGYINTQLHKAIGNSNLFFNYAVWENVAAFKAAFDHPDFRSSLMDYPSSTISSPHLFKRLTIPNLCVGP